MAYAEIIIVAGLIFLFIAANIYATILSIKSEYNEKSQKVTQTFVVWLIPIFGAIFSIAMNREPKSIIKKKEIGNDTTVTNNDAFDLACTSRIGNNHEFDND